MDVQEVVLGGMHVQEVVPGGMPSQEPSPPWISPGIGKSILVLGVTLVGIGYSFAIYKVLSRNWWTLSPSHLLQANYFCATVLTMFWAILVAVLEGHLYPPGLPCLHQPVGLFVKLYHLLALLVMQLERFLAIKLPFLRYCTVLYCIVLYCTVSVP